MQKSPFLKMLTTYQTEAYSDFEQFEQSKAAVWGVFWACYTIFK